MSKFKSSGTFIQNKECFGRMNFLYQASMLMAGRNNTLSTYYGQLCLSVSKKAVLRIEPELKRNLCKRCSLPIKPSITADVVVHQTRKNSNKQKRRCRGKQRADEEMSIDQNAGLELHVVCRQCNYKKNYVVKDHNLWLENPESVAEKISLQHEEC